MYRSDIHELFQDDKENKEITTVYLMPNVDMIVPP